MAVCQITNPRSFDDNGNPTEGGINDLRMGTTDKKLRCATCKCNFNDCPGHFGYIHLAKPVFHVGFIADVHKILKCICYNCKRLLIDDYDKYVEVTKIKNPKERQLKIYNLCKNKKYCRSRVKKGAGEEYDAANDPYAKVGCNYAQPTFKRENLKILMDKSGKKEDDQEEENIQEEVHF